MAQATIHVQPRPYQAWIENGLLNRAGSILGDLLPKTSRIFVVTVAPVRKRWGKKLMAALKSAEFDPQVILMPDGEPAKRLATVEAMAEKLVKMGADRKAVIVALGGGVVGDVAGLLATLYMRGVEFVQVPTTVLAQVDASVGGKTGVNLAAGKNLIGTFYHPRVVLIDPAVLKTLPEREFRAGLYEALKCGIIGNVELFLRFEQNRAKILKRDPVELEWLIAQSVRLKAEVVSADEHEGGLRRVLNLGHTIGQNLDHGDRNGLARVGEHPRHARFAADDSNSHDCLISRKSLGARFQQDRTPLPRTSGIRHLEPKRPGKRSGPASPVKETGHQAENDRRGARNLQGKSGGAGFSSVFGA